MKPIQTTLWGLILILALAPVALAQHSFTEDFTTTAYQDTQSTTALWDTVAGELKLPPLAPTLAGSFDTPAFSFGIDVVGHFAYVADGSSGLHIINITDPGNLIPVGSFGTPGSAGDVVVAGNHAFVTDSVTGLEVVDISDPTNPIPVGSCVTPGTAVNVAVSGNYAFVADGAPGFQVIDITDLSNPVLVGSYDTAVGARDVAVSGDHAFVADGPTGLLVFDISDPVNPALVGSHDTPSSATAVDLSGDHAFVADGSSGLQVIDISDPANPAPAGSIDTPGSTKGVRVSGHHAFVTDGVSGLQMIDISDPGNPDLVWSFDTPGNAFQVVVAGEHAFVADHGAGIQVIRFAGQVTPELLGQSDTLGLGNGVAVAGEHAYVADGFSGLRVFDISEPRSPLQVGVYGTANSALGVSVSGDHAFLANGDSGLLVIDITDPANPALAGSVDTPGHPRWVSVSGDHAFVAEGSTGLQVIDISDPANPVLAGSYDTPSFAYKVTVAGDHAFVADYESGLQVINITDPANPVLSGSCDTPGYAFGITVAGHYAYVADAGAGLQVIDISDPATPSLVGNYDTPGLARGVTVSGNSAFVADDSNGLQAIDISDPANPTLIGGFDTDGEALGLTVAGNNAFVANESYGLQVVQVFQSEVGMFTGIGQSLDMPWTDEEILRARLTLNPPIPFIVQGQPGIFCELAVAKINTVWEPVIPNNPEWVGFPQAGTYFRWRTTHNWGALVGNPTVSSLTVEWLTDKPIIKHVTDIPNDQGRQVSLGWSRSGHDFTDGDTPILEYAVYRRIDGAVSSKAQASLESNLAGASTRAREHAQAMLGAGWHFLTTVPARTQDTYAVVVPTLGDSTVTDGQFLSTFRVSALTNLPYVFYDSQPDSGYSVDDLAPDVPQGLMGTYQADSVVLDWIDAQETDFQYYRIYRDTDPGFDPSPGNRVHETAASTWTDPVTDPWGFHYKVTAVDFAGNESGAGAVAGVSPVIDSGLPTRTRLMAAVPNPFNPATTLSFEIAAAGRTRLDVYDVSGRLVQTLVNGHRAAGRYDIVWNGRDSRGRMSSAGVYLYRLQAAGQVETRRMMLVK